MASPTSGDRAVERVRSLLADDRADSRELVGALERLGRRGQASAFAAALRGLCHLEREDSEARRLLEAILDHRRGLAETLGRDPGLRVSTLDYLSHVEAELVAPTIVEEVRLDELVRSASRDPLTGLQNRRAFEAGLERELRRSRRYGLSLSLVLFDIDRFKSINDNYGHLFGDLVLAKAAATLNRAVRDVDSVCRFGGEEFVMMLPETTRLGAFAVAERIRAAIEGRFSEPTGGRTVGLTISGGVADHPEDGDDRSVLLERADAALYRAKAGGGNRVVLYHSEKRAWVRYPARRREAILLQRESGPGEEFVEPINVSRGGVLVESVSEYHNAELVRLALADRHSSDEGHWAQGRVVRVERRRRRSGRGYRVGIHFERPLPRRWVGARADR